MAPDGAMERFSEWVRKVDAFFDRVQDHHRDSMQCGRGCSDCCCDRLSVTLLEAAAMAQAIGQMQSPQQQALRDWASRKDTATCAALAANGSCMVYAARPIICRTHGVPIRYDRTHLPLVTACSKNFSGGEALTEVAAEDVLDQTTLSATLGALDAAFADEHHLPRGTRIDLAKVLRGDLLLQQVGEGSQ